MSCPLQLNRNIGKLHFKQGDNCKIQDSCKNHPSYRRIRRPTFGIFKRERQIQRHYERDRKTDRYIQREREPEKLMQTDTDAETDTEIDTDIQIQIQNDN